MALTLGLAVLVGVSLGLLGGGGSILMVPLLVHVAGNAPGQAITTSLVVVAVTSTAGAIPHALAGRVHWRTAATFAPVGMVGAYLGGRLSAYLPDRVLLAGFTVLMALTSVAMLRGRRTTNRVPPGPNRHLARTVATGGLVGTVTGLVGAGGGFLVVPALALMGGLALPTAVGTALVVIVANSVAGLAGHLPDLSMDRGLTAGVTVAAVVGGLLGASAAGRIEPDRLRRGFGRLVLLVTALVGVQQAPEPVRTHPATSIVLGLALVGAAVVVARTSARRPRAGPATTGDPDAADTTRTTRSTPTQDEEQNHHVPSHHLPPMREDDLGGLRPARRPGPGRRLPR